MKFLGLAVVAAAGIALYRYVVRWTNEQFGSLL